jgi:hypothetical protein
METVNTEVIPVVVIGDGWAALGACAFLILKGIPVCWVLGSGARVTHPLASVEWGPGVHVWSALLAQLDIHCGELQTGLWIREFRNKAFRAPQWSKALDSEARRELREEFLWGPEQHVVGSFEARWELGLPGELEEDVRRALISVVSPLSDSRGHLQRVEADPVQGFVIRKHSLDGDLGGAGLIDHVKLGSGRDIQCSQVIYADRWGLLPTLEGLPKGLSFLRKYEPMGVLQASFSHDFGSSLGLPGQSFFASLFRDSSRAHSQEADRHIWGHFLSDSKRSVWTLCLSAEEIEDNQEIAKNLRRLKGTLNRIFQGSELIPNGQQDFSSTIVSEQVRFEEEAFFADSNCVEEPITIPGISNLHILTDGYGATRALQQVGSLLGIDVPEEIRSQPVLKAETTDVL